MENWDCHPMDYNSHSGQRLHSHHNPHRCSRNQSFSSALLAAICKSNEDEGEMLAYNKSGSKLERRNVLEAENNRIRRNSRIERQWNEDPWTNNEKFMGGRSTNVGVFNSEINEAEEAAYSKHREFHPSFQSNRSCAALCSSHYISDSTSSCQSLSSDAESLYRQYTSSILTANTERNSHHVGYEERACKWAIAGECSRDLNGKSSVRNVDFGSTEKLFIPAYHHAKMKSKSQTHKDSKKLKQPTSPGRKIVNFLSSLFISDGTKKPKISSSSPLSGSHSYDSSERKPTSVYSSSSSAHSGPGLTKTMTGSKNSSAITQKSVTFNPTTVIVDEDSLSCGKCLYRMKKYPQITHPVPNPTPAYYPQIAHPSADAFKLPLLSKGLKRDILDDERHAVAAAKEIIAKYQKVNGIMEAVVNRGLEKLEEGEEEEEDDDDASCSSSELFELENLAAIDRNLNMCQIELPVYETTHFITNKFVAKGLI